MDRIIAMSSSEDHGVKCKQIREQCKDKRLRGRVGEFLILSMYNWNPKATKPGFRGFEFIYSSYFLPSFLFFPFFFFFLPFLPSHSNPLSLSTRQMARVAFFCSGKARDPPPHHGIQKD